MNNLKNKIFNFLYYTTIFAIGMLASGLFTGLFSNILKNKITFINLYDKNVQVMFGIVLFFIIIIGLFSSESKEKFYQKYKEDDLIGKVITLLSPILVVLFSYVIIYYLNINPYKKALCNGDNDTNTYKFCINPKSMIIIHRKSAYKFDALYSIPEDKIDKITQIDNKFIKFKKDLLHSQILTPEQKEYLKKMTINTSNLMTFKDNKKFYYFAHVVFTSPTVINDDDFNTSMNLVGKLILGKKFYFSDKFIYIPDILFSQNYLHDFTNGTYYAKVSDIYITMNDKILTIQIMKQKNADEYIFKSMHVVENYLVTKNNIKCIKINKFIAKYDISKIENKEAFFKKIMNVIEDSMQVESK